MQTTISTGTFEHEWVKCMVFGLSGMLYGNEAAKVRGRIEKPSGGISGMENIGHADYFTQETRKSLVTSNHQRSRRLSPTD